MEGKCQLIVECKESYTGVKVDKQNKADNGGGWDGMVGRRERSMCEGDVRYI